MRSEGIAWTGPITADITLLKGLILETNRLVVNQGQNVTLSSTNLKASNMGKEDGDLSFVISNLTHGKFTFVVKPDQPIFIFQQQNITDGVVEFVHDNSTSAPSYRVAVSNGTLTTPAQPAFIDFDVLPILIHNQLTIGEGQSLTLISANLLALHNGTADPALTFLAMNVENGAFALLPEFSKNLLGDINFSQQQIINGQVVFFSKNSQSPAYQMTVTDGRMTTGAQPAQITFKIKSIHRYVIQKRLKIAGAWWLEENAENMLALRVNRANNQWDDYWRAKAA